MKFTIFPNSLEKKSMCVCVCETERERKRERKREYLNMLTIGKSRAKDLSMFIVLTFQFL
jgi:hypothetical protein